MFSSGSNSTCKGYWYLIILSLLCFMFYMLPYYSCFIYCTESRAYSENKVVNRLVS